MCDAICASGANTSALESVRELNCAVLEALYGKCGFCKDVRCSMSYDNWLTSLRLVLVNPFLCKPIFHAFGGAEALVNTMIMILYASIEGNVASRNVVGELDSIDRLDLCMRLAICVMKEQQLQRMPVAVLRSSDGKRVLIDMDALK